jgi:hypothetical protein
MVATNVSFFHLATEITLYFGNFIHFHVLNGSGGVSNGFLPGANVILYATSYF